MSFYVFTEDVDGKRGYVGARDSEVVANDLAEDYMGITYVIEADDLVTAKRKLRDKLIRKTEDLGEGYRNVRNKATLEAI